MDEVVIHTFRSFDLSISGAQEQLQSFLLQFEIERQTISKG